MTEIVIATFNSGKAREISAVMTGVPATFTSLADRSGIQPVEENGSTFEENAETKAREYATILGLPCLADDSGLEVDALDGRPGIRSARFAGVPSDDAKNNRRLLDELVDVPDTNRSARFVCVAALAFPDGRLISTRGECPGAIVREYRGDGGFGYDPLFLPTGHDRTFGEMPDDIKDRISHRANAMAQMKKVITDLVEVPVTAERIKTSFDFPDPKAVEQAGECIKAGGIVAARTDTLYGLMADATRAGTVRKVFEAKGRSKGKPISVLAADLAMARTVAVMDEHACDVADKLWPGPVTLVLPAQPDLAHELVGPGTSVAVRIPAAELPFKTIVAAGVPVTGTSANISGRPGAYTADEVIGRLGAHVDLVLDAGPVGDTVPSTLLDIRRWPPRVLRKGTATVQNIETVLGCRIQEDG